MSVTDLKFIIIAAIIKIKYKFGSEMLLDL